MTESYLIKNGIIVNEYAQYPGSIFIENGIIEKILPKGSPLNAYEYRAKIIDGKGRYIIPGIIDDHVHFREPGMEYKADIETESRAAVVGGVTSYMDMPNNKPPVISNELLEEKYKRTDRRSYANYSFYLGANNDNIEQIKGLDIERNCGIKVFMGSSTGNMLSDNQNALEKIFSGAPAIIAAHCEDDQIIKKNLKEAQREFGDNIPFREHPKIRSEEACIKSSIRAKALADKFGAKLHILHLTTEKELELLTSEEDPTKKQITAEVCVHHLWFNDNDYSDKGSLIKWNPSIKSEQDRVALIQALLDDRIDVIATDHAPHTIEEKNENYLNAPSGGPLIQHSLLMVLEFYHRGFIPLEKIVQKMASNPARLFNVRKRGYIKEGFWADLVIIDLNKETSVTKESLHYKCGWSPVEGYTFKSSVTHTFVNGKLVVEEGHIIGKPEGMRLSFNR